MFDRTNQAPHSNKPFEIGVSYKAHCIPVFAFTQGLPGINWRSGDQTSAWVQSLAIPGSPTAVEGAHPVGAPPFPSGVDQPHFFSGVSKAS